MRICAALFFRIVQFALHIYKAICALKNNRASAVTMCLWKWIS